MARCCCASPKHRRTCTDKHVLGGAPQALIQMRGDDGWAQPLDFEEWVDPHPVLAPTPASPERADSAAAVDAVLAAAGLGFADGEGPGPEGVAPSSSVSFKKKKSVEVICKAIDQVEQISADEQVDDPGTASDIHIIFNINSFFLFLFQSIRV